jgi:FkbM family methyltransferase
LSWLIRAKKALASRQLFDNWYSLLASYALAKVGFNVRLKARINDCILDTLPKTYRHLINWYYEGLIKDLECRSGKVFLNGVEVSDINEPLNNSEKLAEVFGWKYDSLCNCWTKNNIRIRHMREAVLRTFDFSIFKDLSVNGRVVVDVGAYIGDTAIYFAWRGARKVIAIEPHSGAYEEMLENIRLNSLETTISPINAGIASRPGKILLEEVDIETTNVTYHRPNDQKGTIPAVTLGDLIREFNLSGAVLKMNCEGCEYDVILNDYEHVKTFKELLFQYHASAKPLLKKLSEDFTCEIVNRDYRLVKCINIDPSL